MRTARDEGWNHRLGEERPLRETDIWWQRQGAGEVGFGNRKEKLLRYPQDRSHL